MTQFRKDLKEARKAEELVYNFLSSLVIDGFSFKMVNNTPEYYHKGDILAIANNGEELGIDVKCDSRIAETGNVLCEEENYFYNTETFKKGYMYSDYDILCVVSEANKMLYFIDFNILKKIYKKGQFKRIYHPEQFCDCYLLELCKVK